MQDLKYPIGKFSFQAPTTGQHQEWIAEIATAPSKYRAAVAGLNERQLDTPYRDGGWTVRQLIHHVPDSHMNAYIRFKLALTEEEPTIKPYDEGAWARLSDTRGTPVEVSLATLENLHTRWVTLLKGMTEDEYQRKLRHPERGLVTLENNLALYAWHSMHHAAHITSLREREGWG
jgi:DinB family protein